MFDQARQIPFMLAQGRHPKMLFLEDFQEFGDNLAGGFEMVEFLVADKDDSYLQGDLPVAVDVGEGAAGDGPGQFLLEVAVHQLGMGKNQGAAAGLFEDPGQLRLGKGKGALFRTDQFLVEIDGIMFPEIDFQVRSVASAALR